jgi:transcription elongation factor GreA
MSDTTALTPAAQRALDTAGQGAVDELEDAWLDVAENPPADPAFYLQFIKAARRGHVLERAHDLLLLAFDQIAKNGNWDLLLAATEHAAGFWPDSQQLRPHAAKALKGVHAAVPNLQHLIAACKGLPLDKVFVRFRELLKLLPGEAYRHAYWGVGVVKALDLPGNQMVAAFPGGERTVAVDFFRKHLTHLPKGSFLASRATEPERLRGLADEDPVALIKLAVQGEGGKLKQSELKSLLTEGVIDEAAWASWWTGARGALRVDPLVDFDPKGGAHAVVALRDHPKTFEEEVEELFFSADATVGQQEAAVQQLADTQRSSGVAPSQDLLVRMIRHLGAAYRVAGSPKGVGGLAYAFIVEDLRALGAPADAAPEIPPPGDLARDIDEYETLAGMESQDHAMRALQLLMERDGDAAFEDAARLLPKAQPRLAQAVWRELDPEHHAQIAVRAVRTLFERPLENPETYLWAARSVVEGRWEHLEDYIPRASLVSDLLDNLESWQHIVERGSDERTVLAAAKLLVGKVRALLQAKNFDALCRAVADMTLEQAQELRRAVQVHGALGEAYREGAGHQMVLTRPELHESATVAQAASEDASVFYCTAWAKARAVRELHELNTVKIPANAKEIEVARAEGDLKENAGYHGAREKHVLLLQQAHDLQRLLGKTVVVQAENVKSDTIAFGNRFAATNLDAGTVEDFIVLGRWESEPGQRIFSYQAPFIQQFIGKKAGDTVDATQPDGAVVRYRIESIANAIAEGEWDNGA